MKKLLKKYLGIVSYNDVAESAIRAVESAKNGALTEIRTATFRAQRSITCEVCGKNVYQSDNWVHTADKAYCLDPCWVTKEV